LFEQFEIEYKKCQEYWEQKLQKYGDSLKELEDEIRTVQESEIQEFDSNIKNSNPKLNRPSSEIINLRFQIEKLVKAQNYIQAANLKKKLKKLEEKNEDIRRKKEIEKTKNKFLTIRKKHENELMALEKRINIGKEEMIKSREKDFMEIHLKFKVLKEKQETQQKQEMIAEEKRLKGFKPTSKYLFKTMEG
jgi:hypothetical protein